VLLAVDAERAVLSRVSVRGSSFAGEFRVERDPSSTAPHPGWRLGELFTQA
jgi:hypothetical protein